MRRRCFPVWEFVTRNCTGDHFGVRAGQIDLVVHLIAFQYLGTTIYYAGFPSRYILYIYKGVLEKHIEGRGGGDRWPLSNLLGADEEDRTGATTGLGLTRLL